MSLFPFQRPACDPTPEACRRAERNSIASACCTSMGDVPFNDAAIIILYATMLGAGDGISMVTTSIFYMSLGLLSIPMGWVTLHGKSYQSTILYATLAVLVMFAFVVLAPFFGSYALAVLLTALVFFAFAHTLYMSSWFPLLDTFLLPERRSAYLGKMRFSWQLASATLLFVIGLLIGKNPPLRHLQYVMLFSMCIYACKFWFIAAIPKFKVDKQKTSSLSFRDGLRTVLRNKPLAGYSVYLFILNLAAYGTIPLTTLYLKKALNAPDNVIVFISSLVLGGMLAGSFFSGRMIKVVGIRTTFLCVHVVYAATNIFLFFMGKGVMADWALFAVIAGILFVYSFFYACANIASSSEMMYLATPGNKVMAMAFCNSFYYSGCGMSRMLTSVILGSGALAASWTAGGITFCHYQTLFLVYGVCVIFAASLLVVVPAIFPKGEYIYAIHR